MFFAHRSVGRHTNDDWDSPGTRATLIRAAEQVGAFAQESGSKDAAPIVTLKPGNDTALISGARDEAGIALVEASERPE